MTDGRRSIVGQLALASSSPSRDALRTATPRTGVPHEWPESGVPQAPLDSASQHGCSLGRERCEQVIAETQPRMPLQHRINPFRIQFVHANTGNINKCACRHETRWVAKIIGGADGDVPGDGCADRSRPLGRSIALECECLSTFAAHDGEAPPGRRVLQLEVVQEAGNVNQLLVDTHAVNGRERKPEEVRPVGVLEHVR